MIIPSWVTKAYEQSALISDTDAYYSSSKAQDDWGSSDPESLYGELANVGIMPTVEQIPDDNHRDSYRKYLTENDISEGELRLARDIVSVAQKESEKVVTKDTEGCGCSFADGTGNIPAGEISLCDMHKNAPSLLERINALAAKQAALLEEASLYMDGTLPMKQAAVPLSEQTESDKPADEPDPSDLSDAQTDMLLRLKQDKSNVVNIFQGEGKSHGLPPGLHYLKNDGDPKALKSALRNLIERSQLVVIHWTDDHLARTIRNLSDEIVEAETLLDEQSPDKEPEPERIPLTPQQIVERLETYAKMNKPDEITGDYPDGFDMPNDDAVDLLSDIIDFAREVTADTKGASQPLPTDLYKPTRLEDWSRLEPLADSDGDWQYYAPGGLLSSSSISRHEAFANGVIMGQALLMMHTLENIVHLAKKDVVSGLIIATAQGAIDLVNGKLETLPPPHAA